MKGLTFSYNKEFCEKNGWQTCFGWDSVQILDQRISCVSYCDCNQHREIFHYEYIANCDGEIVVIDSDDFHEEIMYGIYSVN